MVRLFFQKKKKSKSSSETPLSLDLQQNINQIKTILGSPRDLIIREILLNGSLSCAVVCIDGLVDKQTINEMVLKNIEMKHFEVDREEKPDASVILTQIKNEVLSICEVKQTMYMEELLFALLSGDTLLLLDQSDQALLMGVQKFPTRNVEEPLSEGLVRGPRDGFVENIRVNTVLIRRRIRDTHLRFDSFTVGRRAKKELIIAYIEGVVHPALVEEVKRRVATIDIDEVEESGYVEQWIEDSTLSPFPQIQNTERPDRVASSLVQGRVAIFLDGTPFVLIAPVTLGMMFHSPEDFYLRWYMGTLARILRYISAAIAVFLPALYIALASYHPGMIPSDLAFSIAGAREGVPFPAFVESIMMIGTMELLQEAGIRLPKPIGQTVSIVGGLVIGEAAVSAGIVSPVMVIIVSVTAIATFTLPSYNFAISLRIIRFGVMFAAAMFGLFGIVLFYIMINIHLVNLHSFGIPYTTPFAPGLLQDWKDLVVRAPITLLSKRPKMMQPLDEKRIEKG
ncbi:spore germination protein [Brevibacillus sp. SYSU BS000544]|uniref:spore germination protein n=1 Tax=Brevibacillus sp. SYSU BS000544 TaxID=3416443 RepID=UPI003CE504F5